MDDRRARQPAPDRLGQIPEHVRKWLNSLEEEDIARFHKWADFIVWAETTGRYGRFIVWLSLAAFGASITVSQVWDKWFAKGP
jgi:Rad3-related DNA helicase